MFSYTNLSKVLIPKKFCLSDCHLFILLCQTLALEKVLGFSQNRSAQFLTRSGKGLANNSIPIEARLRN